MDNTLIAIVFLMSVLALRAGYSARGYRLDIEGLKYEVKLLERELANYRDPDAARKEMEEIEKMIIDSLREVYGNGDNDG